MSEKNKKQQDEGSEKLIMIVNGQPIEMCPKTLTMCNRRAQRMLVALKTQSLSKVKTMRFFWGDVVMLNILTNQMLQKVDPKSLSRVLKPVNSLQEDLDEYRAAHQDKVSKMKDAIIIANDNTLPLDYSRELEKYYRDAENDVSNLSIDSLTIPNASNNDGASQLKDEETSQNVDNKLPEIDDIKVTNVVSPVFIENDENEIDVASFFQSKKTVDISNAPIVATTNDKEEQQPKQKSNSTPQVHTHNETQTTNTENKESLPNDAIAQTDKKTNVDELSKHQESFTSFTSIDLDSLFS